ncbi:MAG: glycerol-3-phosphate 1-O-acyltransferase PlsY [Myxococcota bacterium]|nr:glycerol-3-phosphate 1-O-acyltransferase PlsY [Myxococcota bacterium]
MDTATLIALGIGYLIGSIPTGVLVGLYTGADPRTVGSGNIGASNVARASGKKWGLLTLVVDVSKGLVPALVIAHQSGQEAAMITGFAAVIGHCFPVWLKLRGGKGVATAFGAVAAVLPTIAVVSALVWVTILFFTRIPAIASLCAAALFVALPQIDFQPVEVHFFTVGLAVVIILRHVKNIRVLKSRWLKRNEKPQRGRRRSTK